MFLKKLEKHLSTVTTEQENAHLGYLPAILLQALLYKTKVHEIMKYVHTLVLFVFMLCVTVVFCHSV